MPDIDRKFLRLDGAEHTAGCADAIGRPCTCGGEMHFALAQLVADLDDAVDGVPEDLELAAPAEDFDVKLTAGSVRAVRQALANQRAGRS